MDRLTRKNGDIYILRHPECPNGVPTDYQLEQGYYMVLQRLAEYENAEEQGLLVRSESEWINNNRECANCGSYIPTDNVREYIPYEDNKYCHYCGHKMKLKERE